MLKTKKGSSKAELLDWANSLLPSQVPKNTKIEDLGNGVTYLYLLNHLYPGCLTGTKFNKKPVTQYENLNNLKVMVNIFHKLDIKQAADITRIAKMRLQDNYTLIQWFYSLDQKTKHQREKSVKLTSMGTSRLKSSNIKIPDKLSISKPESSHKMDIEQDTQQELKSIKSSFMYLNQIKDIVNSDDYENQSTKLQKIKEILFIHPNKGSQQHKSMITQTKSQRNQQFLENNNNENSEIKYPECITYPKQSQNSTVKNLQQNSQNLQTRYKQYLKSSKRPSVRITSARKQIYEYEQQRLTENSILLNCSPSSHQMAHSGRKSLVSETDLLQE